MTREFAIKEIAQQAGLSLATVDRVIHKRPGVRMQTARRVTQALKELTRQSEQAVLSGRKFMIDLVMEAPDRFASLVRDALEAEMPLLRPAVFRCRFHMNEVFEARAIVSLLDRIGRRGSNGVLLKAPDIPDVSAAVDRLVLRGIPVITLVTDLPHSQRLAYVGIDNRAAGETAAYLIGEWLKGEPADVLVTLSSNRFRGEEEREIGFRRALRERYPAIAIVEVSESLGRDRATEPLASDALDKHSRIAAVYSIGGGNAAVVSAFKSLGRDCRVFVGHDLDHDNIQLLRKGAINAVLHHDLRADMRLCCQHIMRSHRVLSQDSRMPLSQIQVITPYNVPES